MRTHGMTMLRLPVAALFCTALLAGCVASEPHRIPELVPAAAFDLSALPDDADRSDPEAQRALWPRGLYRTVDGQTRASFCGKW